MTKTPVTIDADALRSFLAEEAERDPPTSSPKTVYETVKSLMPEIDMLLSRNRSRREVVDLLASKGVSIGLGTFNTYYARAKRELDPNSVKTRKRRGSKPSGDKPTTQTGTTTEAKNEPSPNSNANRSATPGPGAGQPVKHNLVNDA